MIVLWGTHLVIDLLDALLRLAVLIQDLQEVLVHVFVALEPILDLVDVVNGLVKLDWFGVLPLRLLFLCLLLFLANQVRFFNLVALHGPETTVADAQTGSVAPNSRLSMTECHAPHESHPLRPERRMHSASQLRSASKCLHTAP
jgi:hypothetical protein